MALEAQWWCNTGAGCQGRAGIHRQRQAELDPDRPCQTSSGCLHLQQELAADASGRPFPPQLLSHSATAWRAFSAALTAFLGSACTSLAPDIALTPSNTAGTAAEGLFGAEHGLWDTMRQHCCSSQERAPVALPLCSAPSPISGDLSGSCILALFLSLP